MKKWILVFLCILSSCGQKSSSTTLKVAATATPHAQILQSVKEDLKKEGIDLKVIEVDDYNIPNRSLAEKEVDANYFQHIPFMDDQIKAFGYKITCYAKIHLEPMAMYSKKIKNIKELPLKATIAIPNDPSNEYRALSILQEHKLITLRPGVKLNATIADIQGNPKKFHFKEIDAALLARTLQDVDAAIIPTNFALQAGLNPKQALAFEVQDSPYANILAIREGEEQDSRLQALKKALLSAKTKEFILKNYQNEIIPVQKECR